MSFAKQLLFASLFLFINFSLKAQLEATHLFSKGLSANGFGTFLHAGVPVSKAAEVSGEVGFYYLANNSSHIAMIPFLVGYRHSLNGSGAGWYAEPAAGYNIGATDIQKTDASGNLLYDANGKEIDQKISGFTGAMTIGYIIPSVTFPINFGLRYQHIFVSSGDPSADILSFRVSWSLSAGRRMAASGSK